MSKNKTYDTQKYTVTIDEKVCIGCGTCAALAPKTFVINDKTFKSEVSSPPHDRPQDILSASESCPVNAIILKSKTNSKIVWPKK